MKKQRKQLITMAVFLVVLVAAYIGIGIYNDAEAKIEEDEAIVIMDFDYEDVMAFSYDYNDTNYSFTKSEETWNYDAEPDFDVDESLVEEMLMVVCSLQAAEYHDAYESLDNYGLDTPQKVVYLTFSDGAKVKIQLGDYNDMVGYYYLMVEGDTNLYLVDGTFIDTFDVPYTSLEYIEEETEEGTEEVVTTEAE